MISNRLKIILLVFVFPLMIAVVAGLAYLGIQLILGIQLWVAVATLRSLVGTIVPYTFYITIIPALIVLFVIGFKNRKRIKLK